MSSLNVASLIASSALTASQVQVSVTSANIANADTEGYTAKSVSVTSQSTLGYGAGVSVSGISSSVSKYLMADLLSATSETAGATVTANYLDSLQQSLGQTTGDDGDGNSLANTIAAFETALTDLAQTPESASLASSAVSALEDLTYQVRQQAAEIQEEIATADAEIVDAVTAANQAIETIDTLNGQIEAAAARGAATADLEDDLNAALVTLSEQVEITTFNGEDGTVKVYTSGGQILVGDTAHLLDADTGSDGLTAITVNGTDITDDLDSGRLGALITLRDETLPETLEMLDELATVFVAGMNSVSPGLLTGTGAADIAVSDAVRETPALMLGDTLPSEVAYDMLDVLQSDADFNAAGGHAGGSMTFTEYAGDLLADVVSKATAAATRLELAETELTTVSDTISSTYGVNIDEELVRLSELEQLYSAASTLLSVVQEMFDDLMAAVQ
ncbi:flagellar hook-associated protein FlgK [Roseibium sp.]|uniref:flagellar hook-associated protein FlgK n=1 Tax=Roseibium sp. TaxID=1936156 RepID=UPI003267BADC